MAGEFGLDPADLSALNLIYEYYEAPPTADERFHVRGGNDQLVTGLADLLPEGAIRQDAPLEALTARGGRRLLAGGRRGGAGRERRSRRPLPAVHDASQGGPGELRPEQAEARLHRRARDGHERQGDRPDRAAPAGLPRLERVHDLRRAALPHLGELDRAAGGGRADHDLPGGTERRGRPRRGRAACARLAGAGGGDPRRPRARRPRDRSPPSRSGRRGAITGASTRSSRAPTPPISPASSPASSGSPPLPEGGIHFAGEHTESDFQGYLEGAVRSGERAAAEVAHAVGAELRRLAIAVSRRRSPGERPRRSRAGRSPR